MSHRCTGRKADRARVAAWAIGLAIALSGPASTARAGISFVDMFRGDTFTQTGDGAAISPAGSFLSTSLTSVNPSDYDSAQVTYPGPGSPLGLPSVTPSVFEVQTTLFANQAAMDAAFPMGTYQYAATKGATTDTTSFDYNADHYAQSSPYLAGTTFSALQGMNSAADFHFSFSPDVPGTGINDSFIFLTIFDPKANAFVYDAGFLPSTTTDLTLPANTLLPGHAYTFELIFSNRVLLPSPGAQFQAQIGFDLRTSGQFNTAVPEPAAIGLVAQAGLFLAWSARRRRSRRSTVAAAI